MHVFFNTLFIYDLLWSFKYYCKKFIYICCSFYPNNESICNHRRSCEKVSCPPFWIFLYSILKSAVWLFAQTALPVVSLAKFAHRKWQHYEINKNCNEVEVMSASLVSWSLGWWWNFNWSFGLRCLPESVERCKRLRRKILLMHRVNRWTVLAARCSVFVAHHLQTASSCSKTV